MLFIVTHRLFRSIFPSRSLRHVAGRRGGRVKEWGEIMPRSVIERTDEMSGFGADELEGLTVRRLIYEGDPTEQIVGFIETERVQLVAMPTHGMGVMRRLLIGSVTAKVLHDVACPVLTGVYMGRPPHHLPVTFSNILCAVDLGGKSKDTLAWAAQFARDFQARLTIVNAVPALSPGLELSFGVNWRDNIANLAREDVERLKTRLGRMHQASLSRRVSRPKLFAPSRNRVAPTCWSLAEALRKGSPAGSGPTPYSIIRDSRCPVVSV